MKYLTFFTTIFLIVSCSKQEVLLNEITEDGGTYYYQNEPFTGIGFSNWTTERKKEVIEFNNGLIKSTVRYTEFSFRTKPLDSIVFDENRNIIYQKRWINDDIEIEKTGVENQYGPGDHKNLMNRKIMSHDELKKIVTDPWLIFSYPKNNINSYDEFKDVVENFKVENLIKFWLNVNKTDHIPYLLSGQRYRGDDDTAMFDNLDYHFQGSGQPQIDGRYVYPTDLYIFPEFGSEGTVPGFNIHTRFIDDGYDSKETFIIKHLIYDPSYQLRFGEKNKDQLDLIRNSFYLSEKINDSKYKVYVRPLTIEDERYNDPFKGIYYVFNIDFNTGDFTVDFYSDYHGLDYNLFLVTNEKSYNQYDERSFFKRNSIYDDKIPSVKKSILRFQKQINDDSSLLRKLYNEYKGLSNKIDNSKVDKNDILLENEFLVNAQSGLNLRSQPSSSSNVVLKLEYLDKVEILERTNRSLTIKDYDTLGNFKGNIDGFWVKVKSIINNREYQGYVFDGYLKK